MFNQKRVMFIAILYTYLATATSCQHNKPVIDDFAKLKTFENDLSELCNKHPEISCSPHLKVKISGHHVVSIMIIGRNLNQLPKSIYQFQALQELALEETAFTSLPDLRPLCNLNKLNIENNLFQRPVHLRNLPHSLEYLTLSRDAITELIVDDPLPNLTDFVLTQNRMQSRINSTFCKLPKLSFLDLSSGCCDTEEHAAALEKAAKQILCNKEVAVRAKGEFID